LFDKSVDIEVLGKKLESRMPNVAISADREPRFVVEDEAPVNERVDPMFDRLRPLVEAAKAGEPGALGQLLESSRGYMLAIAARRLPADVKPHLAPSDVVQETAIEAHTGFGGFTGDTAGEFLGWLRGILLHNVCDAVRRRRSYERAIERAGSTPAKPLPVELDTARRTPTATRSPTEASAIRRDEARLVGRVLPTLGEDAREVVRLRYWEELSFVEIGRRLGRTDNAVRKIWFRAVARIEAALRTPSK
jgi:RNA polymerase sigma-70 factor (ECF subfamily)